MSAENASNVLAIIAGRRFESGAELAKAARDPREGDQHQCRLDVAGRTVKLLQAASQNLKRSGGNAMKHVLKSYRVTVHEITELTYTIRARSPKDAERIWRISRDDGARGEPEEDLINHKLVRVEEVDES